MRATGAFWLLLLVLGSPSLLAQQGPPKKMDLVSALGRAKVVKIYSGESVTFHAQERREGIGGIFAPGEYLRGVTFTLRSWPKVRQDAHAIVKGSNRPVIRTQRPEPDLWGMPPSSITIDGGKPGRHLLEATKPGFAPARVVIHLARFELVDIEAELTARHYRASFDIQLVDPDEKGKPIPLLVQILSREGRVIDARDDVVLAPVLMEEGHYRSSRTIRLSSLEVESFRDRLKRRKEDPLPPEFFDRRSLRIAAGSAVRISFRHLHAAYPLPFGY
ncbi:MAG: hypothetical protein ACYS99_00620 [Planctomycetota bacterium]|jgi:hypothetical protein